MSVTTFVPSRANASDGSRIAPRKSALRGELLPNLAVLLIERVVGRHQGKDAAGPDRVERLHEEVIMERVPLPLVLQLHVGKGRVADDRIEGPLGEPRVLKALDANLVLREQSLGDSPGERIELNADEVHPLGSEPQEVPAPAPGFEHGGISRHTEPGQRLNIARTTVGEV